MGWLLNAARNPVESILFIFSMSLLLYALFVMSPFYSPDQGLPPNGSVVADSFPNRLSEFVLGGIFLLFSLPGVVALFLKDGARISCLKLSSFMLFLAYTFLAILRLVIYGPTPVTWLNLLAVSLACGVLRLYLEVRRV